MHAWIEFGSGPLFRLCFALMLLGLARIVVLTIIGMVEAYLRNDDKIINWRELIGKTVSWLFPIAKLLKKRPVYSLVSFLFHIGLILTPLFLAAHLLLWEKSIGFAWFAIPQSLADYLTLIVIVCGLTLFLMRALYGPARAISRKQDYIWPLLLVIPFLTGYMCVNGRISPATYQWMMLIHIFSGNLITVMIPFTKIAHCVLTPLSQLVTGIGWKFPRGAGDKVIETLGYKDRPTWVEQPRLGLEKVTTVEKEAAEK
ncbi:hypothetical protein HQ587_09465 [bacterium]|nr:hypothetical protein [bacterium]